MRSPSDGRSSIPKSRGRTTSIQTIPFFDGDEAPYVDHPLYWNYPVWLRVDPSCSGVYILIDQRQTTYIGKTNNLGKRLLAHHVIGFSTVRKIIKGDLSLIIWPCSDPLMSALETYLIHCFQPKHNRVVPSAELITPDLIGACQEVFTELRKLL